MARGRPHAAAWALPVLAGAVVLWSIPAAGEPLDRLIPDLFGGTLSTTVVQTGTDSSSQQVQVVKRFRNLSAQLSVARSQVPLPSASGAFTFAWDRELDTFVRSDLSLGSIFAERAQTLGRGRFTVGLSYQHVGFDTLDGDSLNHIVARQPALTQAYLNTLPPEDRAQFANDQIATTLNLSFTLDMLYLSAAYGLTDDIDVSLGLTINRAALSGRATAMTLDPDNPDERRVALFTATQPGVITDGSGSICQFPFRCAADSFNGSAVGTGDLYVRGKWHVADFTYADLALAGVLTLPTGNANDFLGFHDPTFTPWVIASKPLGRVAPHVNVGYAIRSDTDVSQFQWIAGADVLTTRWLTLVSDFLGYYDHVNHNVVQSSVGFRLSPIGGLVLSAGFQFPVTRDGLRADVIYTGQLEYNF